MATYKHLLEQVELLKEHLEREHPNPEFIERHALAILELSKDLPFIEPKKMVHRYHFIEETFA